MTSVVLGPRPVSNVMKVVLLENVKGVGKKYDVKNVPDGYARNFLLPKKLVTIATPAMVQKIQKEKAREDAQNKETIATNIATLEKIAQSVLTIKGKANEQRHLYASLKAEDIQNEIKKNHGDIFPLESFHIEKPIRELGDYEVPVRIGEIEKIIKLRVEAV